MLRFELVAADADPVAGPRAGRAVTPHGEFLTPAFMPVGTQATVKSLRPADLEATGAQVVLSNAYHLHLRPGEDVIAAHGGLHSFMGWRGPILTDSGGFQVFSLGRLLDVTEQGVRFRSHLDGSLLEYGPEQAMAVQGLLGADMIMPMDECLPYPADRAYAELAVDRTTRWAERCRRAQANPESQALFGIVQGGVFSDLRRRSAEGLLALDLPGYALGGLSVGEPKEIMFEVLEATVPLLPADRPRYVMGAGTPDLLIEGVRRGVDMFDSVLPTRTARLGTALVPEGRIVVRNAAYANDRRPIQEDCDCYTCRNFTRSYIRHLISAREMLAANLLSVHNLRYLARLMAGMRQAIIGHRFEQFAADFWRCRQEAPVQAGT
ncbi:MAG: tRNA guanosine(34) transglycosylase Tgt [Bacillota bacterium]|nr:tRNA guanosine(34) transglycosylase Tgt [Bacillota bacterium]